MGDFNDEPTNKSILQILGATNKRKNLNYRDLYNLMYDAHNTGNEGSVTYKDAWQMFDQIIVSPILLNKSKNYYLSIGDGKAFKDDQVLIPGTGSGLPALNRTFGGDTYLGGVSDHLPVYIILKKDEK